VAEVIKKNHFGVITVYFTLDGSILQKGEVFEEDNDPLKTQFRNFLCNNTVQGLTDFLDQDTPLFHQQEQSLRSGSGNEKVLHIFSTGTPFYFVSRRGDAPPVAPEYMHAAANTFRYYFWYRFGRAPYNERVLLISDDSLFEEELKADMKGSTTINDSRLSQFFTTVNLHFPRNGTFKQKFLKFTTDMESDGQDLRIKVKVSASLHRRRMSQQRINESDESDDGQSEVNCFLSEDMRVLLMNRATDVLERRKQFPFVWKNSKLGALRKAYDECLFYSLVVQTSAAEIAEFTAAIKAFNALANKTHNTSTENQRRIAKVSGQELRVFIRLRDMRIQRLQQFEGKPDIRWNLASKRFGWTFDGVIATLGKPSDTSVMNGTIADSAQLNILLRANRFGVKIENVKGDGNCLFYALNRAFITAGVQCGRGLHSSLRWLITTKADEFCSQTHTNMESFPMLESLMIRDTQGDLQFGDSSEDKVYVDYTLAMPRLSFIFGMDFRVLCARYSESDDKWDFECHLFECDQVAYEASVSGTSLEGKAPLLEWDHARDAEAIKTFQDNGGLWKFVKLSTTKVTNSKAWTESSRGQSMEETQHNLENGVGLLLGHSSPNKNQIVLAHVMDGTLGHYTSLVSSNADLPQIQIAGDNLSTLNNRVGLTIAKSDTRADLASSIEKRKIQSTGVITTRKSPRNKNRPLDDDDELFPDAEIDEFMDGNLK
jgi:hypothetical protein